MESSLREGKGEADEGVIPTYAKMVKQIHAEEKDESRAGRIISIFCSVLETAKCVDDLKKGLARAIVSAVEELFPPGKKITFSVGDTSHTLPLKDVIIHAAAGREIALGTWNQS